MEEECLDVLIPGLHAFIDYLCDEGHLDAHSDLPPALHATLDDLEGQFRAATGTRPGGPGQGGRCRAASGRGLPPDPPARRGAARRGCRGHDDDAAAPLE
ncbi:MAG: hypothetical protein ACRDTT_26080, partial [Pseudonocardiaceae bacterium]